MMLFPTALLFSHLLILVGATFTDPTQWPGYSNLPLCVQSVFPYIGCPVGCAGGCIPCDIGCGTWTCACGRDYFAAAVSAASSIAATACSTNQADGIASATSIVNGFCNQLLATPTLTGAPSPTSTATGSTVTEPSGGDGGSNSSGLSHRDTIAIGVGIGFGIGLILAVY